MPDITPERKQEIKEMIRQRTAKFANLNALPSTISGRKRKGLALLDEALGMMGTGEWPGIQGMDSLRRRKLENEEEKAFFDKLLEKQRSKAKNDAQQLLNSFFK